MASKKISRLTVYATGQTINTNEHNAEHQQYVDNFNELFKSFDYDGNYHYPLADKVKFNFTSLKLENFASVAHNPDGTVKADKVLEPSWTPSDVKSFLEVSHNPDGTIKSDGIDDPLIYAHNHDANAHPEAIDKHNHDVNAHPEAIGEHNSDPNAHPNLSPIKKPSITSPADGTTDFMGVITSSEYATNDKFYGSHEATDWEISDKPDFSNIVYSSYNNTANLTSLDLSDKRLQPITTYYVRVRYKSMGHASVWSDPVSFTTPANQPPDSTNLQVEGFPVDKNGNLYIVQNQNLQVDFTGATDPDGDPITYEITDAGILVPSKTSGIGDKEKITISAPSVNEDTNVSLSVVAIDDKGAKSSPKIFNILVRHVSFGKVDIFNDGSCISYFPLKSNLTDYANSDSTVITDNITISYSSSYGMQFTSTGPALRFRIPSVVNNYSGNVVLSFQITFESISKCYIFETDGRGNTCHGNYGIEIYTEGYKYKLRSYDSSYVYGPFIPVRLYSTATLIFDIINNVHYYVINTQKGSVSINLNPLCSLSETLSFYAHDSTRYWIKNIRIFKRSLTENEITFLSEEQ